MHPALIGTAAGAAFLTLLVLGSVPRARVPITTLQLVIGTLLLLFGMRWPRKAILRSARVIGLHDKAAIYAEETAALQHAVGAPGARSSLDGVG